ncbi:MAG: VCBS repeat-containing protein [Planctomycetota bacterium]|nr:MAG: VCBS repeat-containing protein [Planctomycetota bacterium]
MKTFRMMEFVVLAAGAARTLVAAPPSLGATLLKTPAECVDLQAADIDGDGHDDLVALCKGFGIVMYRSLGDGRFTDAQIVVKGENITAFATLDLDADGDADLAVILKEENTISLLVDPGAADAPPPQLYKTPDRPGALAAVDLDGDGDDDLIVIAAELKASIGRRLAIQDGRITASHTIAAAPPTHGRNPMNQNVMWASTHAAMMMMTPDAVAIGDFTGDGAADLAVGTALGQGVYPLVAVGDDFDLADQVSALPGPSLVGDVELVDLNGDGRADLVAAPDVVGKGLGVRFALVDGGFGDLLILAPEQWITNLAVGDLDGDGLPDILAAKQDGMAPALLIHNRGDGTFATPVQIGQRQTIGALGGPVALGSFDADDDLDAAVAFFGGGVGVFFNRGDGRLDARPARTDRPHGGDPPY